MKKNLMIIALLAVLMTLPQSILAQEDNETEYECSCILTCKWEYTIWNPACLGWKGTLGIAYSGATTAQPEQKAVCESSNYADQQCRQKTWDDVGDQLNEDPRNYCPDGRGVVWATQEYLGYEGSCTLQEKSCFSILLLGVEDPRLETLRQFRDNVLSKTSSGKKLIQLYYGYSDIIIEILAANPVLKTQAKALLEQFIPQIEALVQGKSANLLISDSLQQSADAVISALDAGLANPLQEKVAPLQKDMEASGLIKR